MRKEYYFLTFDIMDTNESFKVIIKSANKYNSVASAKFIISILLSMYEAAEKIVTNINLKI